MGLIKATCPGCGANIDYDTEREFCFCTYCGAKVMQDKVIVEHRGKVNVEGVATVDTLLERATILLEHGQFADAEAHVDKVLDISQKNSEACIAKLLCVCNATKVGDLKNYRKPLEDLPEYKIALQFCSDKEKTMLSEQNAFTKENYKHDKYDEETKSIRARLKEISNELSELYAKKETLPSSEASLIIKNIILAVFVFLSTGGFVYCIKSMINTADKSSSAAIIPAIGCICVIALCIAIIKRIIKNTEIIYSYTSLSSDIHSLKQEEHKLNNDLKYR